MTEITDYDVNWAKIRNACMTTISKDGGDKEPSKEWKRKLLLCQHSPIRRGTISWKWQEIPFCIARTFCTSSRRLRKIYFYLKRR